MPIDARRTLSENISWLLANTETDSQAKLAKQAKLDQKTVSRMVNNTNAATVDSLQAIAAVHKIEAWQLLAPAFGEGLHRIKGTSIVPVDRPGTAANPAPAARNDRLGIPYFKPTVQPPDEALAPSATSGPRAGKRSSSSLPKSVARAKR